MTSSTSHVRLILTPTPEGKAAKVDLGAVARHHEWGTNHLATGGRTNIEYHCTDVPMGHLDTGGTSSDDLKAGAEYIESDTPQAQACSRTPCTPCNGPTRRSMLKSTVLNSCGL